MSPQAFDKGASGLHPPMEGTWTWESRRLGLGAEGRPAWGGGVRGVLPPMSVGTGSRQPLVRKMLAAQPETVRQDLSQIKGTCGILSQPEGSSWKKPIGLLSGGSPRNVNH